MSSARVAIIGGGLSPSFAKTLREVSCDPARYQLLDLATLQPAARAG